MNPDLTDVDRSKAARWERLLALLADRRRLTVAEVATELGISPATARRDFNELAARQLATRTHGGVVATSVAYGLPQRFRDLEGAKQRIAQAAASMAAAGEVIGFNGGTTTLAAATELGRRTDLVSDGGQPALTVVTSALNLAVEMVLRPHIRTVCLGGIAIPESYELIGPMAIQMARQMWLDKLFLGALGIDAQAGATCQNPNEAGLMLALTQQSREVIILATSDKLRVRSFAQLCPPSAITCVVTDDGASEEALDELRSAGMDVMAV